jgi:hypothetical protein
LFSSTQYTEEYHAYTTFDAYISQTVPIGGDWSLLLKGNVQGTIGDVPLQKQYYLNGANPSQQDRNSFWKAITSIDRHFSEQSHFFVEGGKGVRGYTTSDASGNGGFGITGELTMPNPIASWGWLPRSFQPLLFGDVSDGGYGDAGIGFRLDLLSWLPWQLQGVAEEYANIPKIGIYFPVFLSHPDDGKENIAFRYVISLGTTF